LKSKASPLATPASRQNENDVLSLSMIQLFAPLLIDAAMVAFYLIVVLEYSVLLTGIGVSSLAVSYAINRYVAKKSLDFARVASRDSAKLGSMTVAGVEMIETIKSAGAEDGFFEKWSGLHAAANDVQLREEKLKSSVGFVPQLASGAINVFILLTGAWLIIRGDMTVGVFFAFQGFLAAFLAPLTKLINLRMEMQRTKISMERVQDVFNYKTDVEYREFDTGEGFYKLTGQIEIKDLTFGYNRLAPPLLEKFNLTVKPGESVALVGASGCGQSTVAKL
jgi:ABC-type bacteriocin/lantibiotic exporter with double-glycine peptidase domain